MTAQPDILYLFTRMPLRGHRKPAEGFRFA